MKIIVVSDTHMPKKRRGLPEILKEDLRNGNLIIHAGDFQTLDVYKEFMEYGELIAVVGNVDDPDLKEVLPKKKNHHEKRTENWCGARRREGKNNGKKSS